ncbi:MAG: hypothetical protein OEY22_10205 [Candidatus Bathyarchaeota archaeon]|nr:hypothetical protein [Candidatus Bathyarchaeota archaeon]MDH5788709.1 hypothetical protein [Candidatus Bathyarchaeota archaeon]
MDDFETALQNIDVFCKVLVSKMIVNEENSNIIVEPMENLLQGKYVIREQFDSSPLSKNFIPLPQVEEPLIDVFEEDEYVRVLVQCRCKEQEVTIHTDMDGLEICRKECNTDTDGLQVCRDECKKLNLPIRILRTENMISKCNNNEIFEVTIPKK